MCFDHGSGALFFNRLSGVIWSAAAVGPSAPAQRFALVGLSRTEWAIFCCCVLRAWEHDEAHKRGRSELPDLALDQHLCHLRNVKLLQRQTLHLHPALLHRPKALCISYVNHHVDIHEKRRICIISEGLLNLWASPE